MAESIGFVKKVMWIGIPPLPFASYMISASHLSSLSPPYAVAQINEVACVCGKGLISAFYHISNTIILGSCEVSVDHHSY